MSVTIPVWLLTALAWGLVVVGVLAAAWFLLWAAGVLLGHVLRHLGYWKRFLRWAASDIERERLNEEDEG